MPIVNRLSDLHAEITEWRRDIHAHPELQSDVQRTADLRSAPVIAASTSSSAPELEHITAGAELSSGKLTSSPSRSRRLISSQVVAGSIPAPLTSKIK